MAKKWFLGLALAASLSVVTACGGSGGDNPQPQQSGASSQPSEGTAAAQPEMPEPDVAGVPDVVAEVNGEAIAKDEFVTTYQSQFQRLAMQSQMAGQEVDQDQLKTQTAENMVGTELLIQEADNRGLEASEEDVTNLLNELAETNQLGSGDEFMAALKEQGMSEDEVNAQLETQVKVEQLIAEEAGDTKPTEEELKAAYEQYKSQQEQMGGEGQSAEVPALEDVRPQLEEQLTRQKEGQAAQALVEKLRADADVTIHL